MKEKIKNFTENIKTNKLRSALIGLSAFLFGFISVSIFNNIGDTYAVLECSKDGYKVVDEKLQRCCPEGYEYNSTTLACTKYTTVALCPFDFYIPDAMTGGITGVCTTPSLPAHEKYTGVFIGNGGTVNNVTVYPGGDTSSGYLTCRPTNGNTTCSLDRKPSAERELYTFNGWGTTEDCTRGTIITKLSGDKTYYACWSENSACYVCGNSQAGGYYYGKYANSRQCALYSKTLSAEECSAKNKSTVKPVKPDEGADTSTGESAGTGTSDTGTTYVVANVKNYYAITYNLNGGHFIDDSTTRTEYMTGGNALGNMKTNPIKDGYVFIEWQYNGNSFDFSKTLDSLNLTDENSNTKDVIEITLKAVWEEYDDETLYCEDENAVLDYSTNKCYTVLKEDASNNIYTHTTYKYNYVAGSQNVRFCYSYDPHNGDETPGGVYWRQSDNDITNNIVMESSGKQNKTDGVYANYEGNDYWISSETCRIASKCYESSQSVDYPASSCEITYSAILYHEEDALEDEYEIPTEEPDTPPDGGEDPDTPSDGNEGTVTPPDEDNQDGNDKTDEDLTNKDAEDIKTGDVLIIFAWIVGLGALGYTAYYFIKRKNNV